MSLMASVELRWATNGWKNSGTTSVKLIMTTLGRHQCGDQCNDRFSEAFNDPQDSFGIGKLEPLNLDISLKGP